MTPKEYADVLGKSASWIEEAMRQNGREVQGYRLTLLRSALAGVKRVRADAWGTVEEMLEADDAWSRRPLR